MTHASQPSRPRSPWLMSLSMPPVVALLDARRDRRRARAEAFLLHVELDGAPDCSIHVGGWPPAEVAPGGFDVRYAHLDVLVVLAVVLAGGDVDDLRGPGVIAQHRELLRNPDGALCQIADRDAVGRVTDVENTPAGDAIRVLEDRQQGFDSIVDVGKRALLAAAVDQPDRPLVEHVGEKLGEHPRAAFLGLLDIIEIRTDEIERPEQGVVEV